MGRGGVMRGCHESVSVDRLCQYRVLILVRVVRLRGGVEWVEMVLCECVMRVCP